MAVRKPSDQQIAYIIREKKNASSTIIATRIGVTPQRVRQIYAHYVKTGDIPPKRKVGRPKREPTQKEIQMVIEVYDANPQSAIRITKYLRANHIQISYSTVRKIMKAEGLTAPARAKRKRRKWIRYERRHSNAMWHVDWHIIKDSRWQNLYLICYLDDASRCITGFGVYPHATADNTILTLDAAIESFGVPAQILSDCSNYYGTQFTSNKEPKKGHKKPTLFEKELSKRKIIHLLARVNHPQTNGKLERFFGTFEREIAHYSRIDEYIGYYNESRLHFALNMDDGETPLMAFRSKQDDDKTRANSKWMEEDAYEGK